MLKRLRHSMLAVLAVTATSGMVGAAELSPATGQVVLTIVGNINHTNRGGFDEFEDPFTNYHERTFEKAAEFDHAMLESLGMKEVEVNYEGWPRPVRLAGPGLDAVLEAVGAEPESITTLALDGFAVDLTSDMISQEDWIVAIKQDGHYMNIGQRGPAWIVFDPGDDNAITAEEEGSWPWAAFFIEVR